MFQPSPSISPVVLPPELRGVSAAMYSPPVVNTPGGGIYILKGSVRTREHCPVCGGSFTLQIIGTMPGLYCERGCRTVPRRYWVDALTHYIRTDAPLAVAGRREGR
jgi:hypothetical protein